MVFILQKDSVGLPIYLIIGNNCGQALVCVKTAHYIVSMESTNQSKKEHLTPDQRGMKRVAFFVPDHLYDRIVYLANYQKQTKSSVMQFALALGISQLEAQFLGNAKRVTDQNAETVSVLREFAEIMKKMEPMP
jgi:predicted DNA-binding protein